MPKVSVVILTYNSSKHIIPLLQSLEKTHQDFKEIEIIIADNSSTDNTLDLVKRSRLKVNEIIEIPKNIGFAAGINKGVQRANGELLLFLNPDTKFIKGDLFRMADLFNNEKIGIVGGKMKNEKTDEKSAGKNLNLFATLMLIVGLDEVLGIRFSPKKEQKVGFVSGGFMMIRRELFEKLSGFDEKFFMYVEDADLCFRAGELGKITYFSPEIVVQHEAHGSSNREFAIENICKNLIYYHKKHSSRIAYLIVKSLLKLKAYFLVIIGRLVGNNNLVDAYIGVTKL